MANPILATQVTPYLGWTLAQAVEQLLETRGMTEDATTGRTVATASDSAGARTRIRRAVAALHQEFPGYFANRTYTVAWTLGDHSIELPSDVANPLSVMLGGVPLRHLDDEAWLRDTVADADGRDASDQIKTTTISKYYRITGVGSTNFYMVMRIYEQPTEASTLEIKYVSKAPALTTDAQVLPYSTEFQEWILHKARLLWSSDANDRVTKQNALEDLQMQTAVVLEAMDGSREAKTVARWRFPTQGAIRHTR